MSRGASSVLLISETLCPLMRICLIECTLDMLIICLSSLSCRYRSKTRIDIGYGRHVRCQGVEFLHAKLSRITLPYTPPEVCGRHRMGIKKMSGRHAAERAGAWGAQSRCARLSAVLLQDRVMLFAEGASAMVVSLFCRHTQGATFSIAGDDLLRSEHPRY